MIVGLGTDIIEIARIEKAMCNPRFLERIYTQGERERIAQRGAERAAGYFAAKEAAMKALGTGMAVPFTSIEISYAQSGQPRLALHGKAQARAQALGVVAMHVSISHGREAAIATVVLEG